MNEARNIQLKGTHDIYDIVAKFMRHIKYTMDKMK